MNNDILKLLEMTHSPVDNYVIPGLKSMLIGGRHSDGSCVRIFKCNRNHQENITPHSHRFDFTSVILSGKVRHKVWDPCDKDAGDLFTLSKIDYHGAIGSHSREECGVDYYAFKEKTYSAGEIYSLGIDEIHSIEFEKGTVVVLFEGEQQRDHSYIIEPHVNGATCETMLVAPYMFRRPI